MTSTRFVAAFAVALNHLADVFEPSLPAYAEELVQAGGRIGVSYFFVLSGFVLTWAGSLRDGTRRFYRRRVARIVPAYLIAWLLGLVLVAATSSGPTGIESLLGAGLVQAWHPDPDVHFGGNPVAWSLSVEVVFYALYPMAIWFLGRAVPGSLRRVAVVLVGAVIGWAVVATVADQHPTSWMVSVLPLVRIPEFLLGILAAEHLARGGRPPVTLRAAVALTVAGVVLLPVVPGAWQPYALTLVPFTVLLIALADRDQRVGRSLLALPALLRLGEWSFAFYLVHVIVFSSADELVDLRSFPAAGQIGAACALLGLGLLAAAALYTGVERPAERRLRGGDRGPVGAGRARAPHPASSTPPAEDPAP